MQNSIIAFCYFFILGLAAAMALEIEPGRLSILRAAAAIAFLPGLAVWILRALRKARSDGPAADASPPAWKRALLFLCLVLPAFLAGMTRHMEADTRPDMRIGAIVVREGAAAYRAARPLEEPSRLILVKRSADGPLRVRLRGELDALMPALDETGRARMSADGRWMFRRIRREQVGDWIEFAADAPVGAARAVETPFTRIEAVEAEGRGGRLDVLRVSHHAESFARSGRPTPPVTVLGRIAGDPRVYGYKTVLPVSPRFIQFRSGGTFYPVSGGQIDVSIRPGMTAYEDLARSASYGMDVQVEGPLTAAARAANPGGFDARAYLRNHHVYGTMYPSQRRGAPSPIAVVQPEGRGPRSGNPLVEFSLDLRDRLLARIKQTMPYPQSAFLGGVTLGMRYGLQSTRFSWDTLLSSRPVRDEEVESDALVFDDFKAAGVNHVLAVSGLHVTIITLLFVGLFTLLRAPRRLYAPIVVLILIVFAIITGARPSTLRAVIMNSLFLLTWAYLGQNLRASVLFGIPVAAFLILLQNPRMLTDPSFTLSFGAILSLALLTTPFHAVFSRLEGLPFLSVAFFLLAATAVGIAHWPLLTAPAFWIPFLALAAAATAVGARLERRGVRPIGSVGFLSLPAGVAAFLCAQFGIQIGMMIPLSAFYFSRWPFAGAYANLVAIPLIGIVLQLGIMAGLFGFIPWAGGLLALLLNAANWIFATLFLVLAHVSASVFPHPFVPRPSFRELLVYYGVVAAFVWHASLWNRASETIRRGGRRGWVRVGAVAGAGWLLITAPLWTAPVSRDEPACRLTVLSTGYGSSVFVETPGGKSLLIDAGSAQYERGMINQAERTVLPFLCREDRLSLDAVFLLSPRPERAAGLSRILEHCRVGALYLPPRVASLEAGMTFDAFQQTLIGDSPADRALGGQSEAAYHELCGNPSRPGRPSLAGMIRRRRDTLWNRWAGWDVEVRTLERGQVLMEETVGGRSFRVEVLGPDPGHAWRTLPGENGSAVLRIVYGDTAVLLTGDLHYEGQEWLAQRGGDAPRADVLLAPHRGTARPLGAPDEKWAVEQALVRSTKPLLEAVRPTAAIFEYGFPRPVLGRDSFDAERAFELTARLYGDVLGRDRLFRTDRDQAVFVTLDGRSVSIETQAERNRETGGDVDAVEEVDVGL
jgi:competence protein ComEC